MVLSMERWVGKVAVVTGASSGIGAAIAEALVEQGLKVVGFDLNKDRLESMAQNLSNKKGKLYAVRADVSKEGDIVNAFKWTKENVGSIHVLVNNAGIFRESSLLDGDANLWRTTFEVNVLGLSIVTREAVKDMRANNVNGHIIHLNSVLGHEVPGMKALNVYPASKFAVTALAETLRLELLNLRSKIKITSISPGFVDTVILPDSIKDKFQGEKLMIEPDNVADAVVYALSTPPHVQVQELTVRSVDESFWKDLS